MEIIALTLAIGLLVGVVVGALGAGGGILAVPVLVYLLGQDPHDATAMSLVIVAVTSLASIRHHARAGNVAWRDGLVFASLSTVGAVLGSRLQGFVDGTVLMILLAALLVVVSLAMLRKGLRTRRQENRAEVDAARRHEASHGGRAEVTETVADHSESREERDHPVLDAPGPEHVPAEATGQASWPLLIAAASTTGLLTGFFGVGGGFIVVPMLVLALGLAMRRASGTSLLVMLMTTLVSLLSRIGTDVQVDWTVTLLFAGASAVGGIIGGPLSAKARSSTLTLIFAALLAAVAASTFAQNLVG